MAHILPDHSATPGLSPCMHKILESFKNGSVDLSINFLTTRSKVSGSSTFYKKNNAQDLHLFTSRIFVCPFCPLFWGIHLNQPLILFLEGITYFKEKFIFEKKTLKKGWED